MSTIAIDARKIADFGIGTYVRGLVAALARIDRHHRYLLLAPADAADQLPMLPGNFRWVEERAPGYSLRELWSLARAVRRERAELLHAPHYVLPFALPCPAVVTVHDLIHLRFPEMLSAPARGYARFMLRRATRLAQRVLTVSATTARELEQELGVSAERIVVAPNGVDEAFRADPEPEAAARLRARHGLAPGYLLFVGNPKPHKNLDRLLAAYSALRRRRPQAPPLVLAGDRLGERSGLPAAIEAAGLGEAVRTLGHLPADELPALYRGAAILVQPSLWEGFGLPVAEAMAAGTPVIAARRGALPEVAGEAARLVDPESVEEIAAAIEALLDDPAERLRLARAGRARAEGFRWEECARRVLATYEEVLAESRGARP